MSLSWPPKPIPFFFFFTLSYHCFFPTERNSFVPHSPRAGERFHVLLGMLWPSSGPPSPPLPFLIYKNYPFAFFPLFASPRWSCYTAFPPPFTSTVTHFFRTLNAFRAMSQLLPAKYFFYNPVGVFSSSVLVSYRRSFSAHHPL